ncbi:MAG: hypothetical protein PHE18_02410 [Candidatus Omnitrophica bacterium]|nr:hypothetical protein [Candidatus Omnitrophota bacterium]MDD5552706.1 hypothetical protein [Candidatus Omnitrophota bacterium]
MGGLGNILQDHISDILNNRAEEARRRMLCCEKACEYFVNCFFEDE